MLGSLLESREFSSKTGVLKTCKIVMKCHVKSLEPHYGLADMPYDAPAEYAAASTFALARRGSKPLVLLPLKLWDSVPKSEIFAGHSLVQRHAQGRNSTSACVYLSPSFLLLLPLQSARTDARHLDMEFLFLLILFRCRNKLGVGLRT